MLVRMKKQLFDWLNDTELGWACLEPAIQKIRGKDNTVKSQVYSELTPGQQALLMFKSLYGHAHSVAEFYWFASYFLADMKAWPAMKRGIQFFGDEAMLQLYESIQAVIEAKNLQPDGTWREAAAMDLDDDGELRAEVDRIFTMYHEIAPYTLKRIDSYIRNHPDQFVHLED